MVGNAWTGIGCQELDDGGAISVTCVTPCNVGAAAPPFGCRDSRKSLHTNRRVI